MAQADRAHDGEAMSIGLIEEIHRKCAGRVKYRLGAKPRLGMQSTDIERSDCSGYVRYLLDRCGISIPDGSQNQLAWAEKNLRKLGKYADVEYAKNDSRLFIAFLRVTPKRKVGHVWLVLKGQSIESCSSLGVGSRPWNHRALKSCADCFEIVLK